MAKETIVVIGAGVIGLSSALCIQRLLGLSQEILIVARDLPGTTSINYASPWAGAHYRPVPGESSQLRAEAKWAKRTYEVFEQIARLDIDAGVRFLDGIEHFEESREILALSFDDPESPYAHLRNFRTLSKEELPPDIKFGISYLTYCVNAPIYCQHLLRKFISAGGRVKQLTLVDVQEAFFITENVSVVINCSGSGLGDLDAFIIRGQICLVSNPVSMTLTRQNADGSWSFCIPRAPNGGTIIGGTKQEDDWIPDAIPEIRSSLLQNASKWFPFEPSCEGKFNVIRDIVGRRPARKGGVRLELEHVSTKGKRAVIHAYGFGGRGYELSWGAAEDVSRLLLENGFVQTKASL